jgi:hypothetical protein
MSILNSLKERDWANEPSWKLEALAELVEQEYNNLGCSRDFLSNALKLQPILATRFVPHIVAHFEQPNRKYLQGKRNPFRQASDAAIVEYFYFGPFGKKFFYGSEGDQKEGLEASLMAWRTKSYDEKLYEIEQRYPMYNRKMLEKICLKRKK